MAAPKEIIRTKATSVKDIMAFIKANKKEFFRSTKDQWGTRLFYTMCASTGWQAELKKHYLHTDPNKGDEYLAIGRAIQAWFEVIPPFPIFSMVIMKLHMRYAEKIAAKWEVKKPRPPMMSWTNISKELLERGFIHVLDFMVRHKDSLEELSKKRTPHLIICKNCVLIHPTLFFDKEEAEKVNDTHGMPNLTQIISDLSQMDEEDSPF